MIEHLVFLLEEPSAEDFLRGVLPHWLPPEVVPHFLVFEGKQDLEKQLVRRLKGWVRPNSRFVILRDQDSGDCVRIKQHLADLCTQAGKSEAIVRIACRELEAFFVGDWQAVAEAFDKPALAANDLLEHWRDPDSNRSNALYFCQLEAIETLIWHVEAAAEFKQGLAIPGDGGPWERLCNKMATGAGKTTVMAMIIVWQVLNALTYPKRRRDFSHAVFIVTPGLTVKERLQVLRPGHPDNYYDAFALCPNEALRQKLNRVELAIENWHNLMPLKSQGRSVVKKGAESDAAFVKRVLGPLAECRDLVIINDEAHHAYRKPAELKVSRKEAKALGLDLDESTRWIEGLDRIHGQRRIGRCFDLSATPFAPTGKTNTEAGLFDWVVSDFGLYDAIEAGLVKTPRVVIRDDALPNAQTYRSKLYHLYREPEVAEDLNRRGAEPQEALPQLVQEAYNLLGADWRETLEAWQTGGQVSPPAMLTVCNRVETAARIGDLSSRPNGHAERTAWRITG